MSVTQGLGVVPVLQLLLSNNNTLQRLIVAIIIDLDANQIRENKYLGLLDTPSARFANKYIFIKVDT